MHSLEFLPTSPVSGQEKSTGAERFLCQGPSHWLDQVVSYLASLCSLCPLASNLVLEEGTLLSPWGLQASPSPHSKLPPCCPAMIPEPWDALTWRDNTEIIALLGKSCLFAANGMGMQTEGRSTHGDTKLGQLVAHMEACTGRVLLSSNDWIMPFSRFYRGCLVS